MLHRCAVCTRCVEAGQPHACLPPQPIDLRKGAPVLVSEPHRGSEKAA